MKQKIKIALCVRVAVLLIGPGLQYLLTNTFVNNENKSDAPSSDGKPTNKSVQCSKSLTHFSFSTSSSIPSTTAECRRRSRWIEISAGGWVGCCEKRFCSGSYSEASESQFHGWRTCQTQQEKSTNNFSCSRCVLLLLDAGRHLWWIFHWIYWNVMPKWVEFLSKITRIFYFDCFNSNL